MQVRLALLIVLLATCVHGQTFAFKDSLPWAQSGVKYAGRASSTIPDSTYIFNVFRSGSDRVTSFSIEIGFKNQGTGFITIDEKRDVWVRGKAFRVAGDTLVNYVAPFPSQFVLHRESGYGAVFAIVHLRTERQ